MTENNENNDNDNTEETDCLTWNVKRGELIVATEAPRTDQVRITLGNSYRYLPIEDAREVFTHALVNMGGSVERADTVVAEVALELCKHHSDMRERAEKRLADLQEKHALQARHLGEYMGRLKKYE